MTARPRHALALIAFCVLAITALAYNREGWVESDVITANSGVQCSVYKPQRCWYEIIDPKQPPFMPVCMEKHKCNFNMTERLECPFYEAGNYELVTSEVCHLLQNSGDILMDAHIAMPSFWAVTESPTSSKANPIDSDPPLSYSPP